MQLKLKKSDINLIIMLVGILLAVGAYLLYGSLTEKTETMKAQNASLEKDVQYLQELANNKQKYIDDTVAMQGEIEGIKAQFPAQYLPEDDILYVVAIEKSHDAQANSIAMADTTVIEVATEQQEAAADPAASAAPAEEEGAEAVENEATPAQEVAAPEIMLYKTPVTMDMVASYDSVKDIIKKINTDEYRKGIETLTLSFDSETGDLYANFAMNMYSLTGTEAVYSTPEVSGVVYGTNNIFNSASKKAAIKAEEAAQAEADAEKEAEEKKN